MRRGILFIISMMLLLSAFSFSTAVSEQTTGPELKVGLWTCIGFGFSEHTMEIAVENIGDSTAHNVVLTDLTINGMVIYNNRETEWGRDVSPGTTMLACPNSMFLGVGPFEATMTVTCDEGVQATGTGNGIMIGPLIFVP
jgi:hypothetical protein